MTKEDIEKQVIRSLELTETNDTESTASSSQAEIPSLSLHSKCFRSVSSIYSKLHMTILLAVCVLIFLIVALYMNTPTSKQDFSLENINDAHPTATETDPGFHATRKPSVLVTASPTKKITSSPSLSPTIGPSLSPSVQPSFLPWVTESFKIRLYWEEGFYWQAERHETFWCMECTRCKIYTRGDGWEGDCESSGDNSDDCKEGDLIWIRDCYDDRDFKFEILKNYGTGDQIRVSDTNLCFETYLRFLELRPCDVTNERQLWNSIDDLSKFELRPYRQRDKPMDKAMCLSQLHHPKSREVVALHSCRANFDQETLYWEEFYAD